MVHFAGVAATDITLTYTNAYVAGTAGAQGTDTPGPTTYPISAAIEIDGVVIPVTFGGDAVVNLAPGASVTSDPVPGVALFPTKQFFSRTYINSVNWYPTRVNTRASGEGGWSSSDLTLAGSGAIADSIHAMFTPTRVGGRGVAGASLIAIGDSITGGSGEFNSNDGGFNSSGLSGQAGGFVNRAAYGRAGVTSIARGGDLLNWFLNTKGHLYRLPLAAGFTHAICGYGINDITYAGGRTLAQVQADMISLWQILANMGLKVGQSTVCPYTTSTDAWTTIANQTVRPQESVRVAFNTWLRAGAPVSGSPLVADSEGTLVAGQPGHPLANVFDTTSVVESSFNSGKFRVDLGTPTSDGVHPWTALHIQMAQQIPASFFAV